VWVFTVLGISGRSFSRFLSEGLEFYGWQNSTTLLIIQFSALMMMNWKPLILLVALMAAAGHAHEVEEMGNGDVQVNGAGKEELVGFATTDTLKSASYDELMEEAVRRGLIKEDHAEEEEKEYEIRESRDDGGYGIPSAVSTDDELGEEMRTQKNVDQVMSLTRIN